MPNPATGGEVYTGETLRPHRMVVWAASGITTDGVESLTLLEIEGDLGGIPYSFAIEFSAENGAKLGRSMATVHNLEQP